ncbi:18558_t:CDS:1, partial [Racocetra persica]
MKKHFTTKHNGDWREYVKNRKFNEKLLLAQEIAKKSVKKPDTSDPIRKLQNTKSVEKKNIRETKMLRNLMLSLRK